MNNVEEYKNQIDLNEIVKLFGYKFIREKSSKQSKQYRGDQWNKIVVMRKDGKYFYFDIQNKDNKGSIIDFLINHGVKSINEAINWCKDYVESGDYTIPEPEEPELKSETQLDKIWTSIKNINPIPKIRGIKPNIWQHAIEAKNLKIDKDLNIYLALVNLKGLCGIEVRNGSEKRLIKDSTKGIWWYGEKINKTKMIVVCESGIDALSYIQLHGDNGETTYIATIGQYGQLTKEIITAIAKANKQAEWRIAMDNDQAGDQMAKQITADILEINNVAVTKRAKSTHKDWNDDLQSGEKEVNMSDEIDQNVIETFGGAVVEEKQSKEIEMQEKEPAVEEQAVDNGNNGNNKANGEENQDKYATPYVTAAELVSEESVPTDFVVGGLPLGQLGLLIGSDGIGKSMLALQMAVSVACGINVAGGAIPAPETTGVVTYVYCEDDRDEMRRKVKVVKNNIGNITAFENLRIVVTEGERWPLVTTSASLNYKGIDNELITQFVEKKNYEYLLDENMILNLTFFKKLMWLMHQSRLVIIDPLVMFHNLEENDNGHMDYLARLLIRMAKEAKCAILAVHHTGQEAIVNSRDDHQAGRGATALAAAARAVWVLRRLNKKEEENNKDHSPLRLRKLRGSKVSRAVEIDSVLLRVEDDGMLVKTEILEGGKNGSKRFQ